MGCPNCGSSISSKSKTPKTHTYNVYDEVTGKLIKTVTVSTEPVAKSGVKPTVKNTP